MKKLLLLFILLFNLTLPVKAKVMPYYVNSINPNSIGVFQTQNKIRVYKEPNEKSELLFEVNWDKESFNCPEVSAGNLFAVFFPKKDLAFLTVIDENEDEEWVQISFNKDGLKNGWVKKYDRYRFMNWRTFFNLYGRKYGLYYLKDTPDEYKVMYGTPAKDAKSIGKITMPQTLKLTSVSGNWLLIIAYDIDKYQKIGWIKWRNISGQIFLFPDIK